MKQSIHFKPFLIISFAFIVFTIIGTLSHELGHIVVAKKLGYTTRLSYGSMIYYNLSLNEKIEPLYTTDKVAYKKTVNQRQTNTLYVSIGGPLQTMLTSFLGLVLIFWRRKEIQLYGLKVFDWVAVFLGLFCLREVFNLMMYIARELISPKGSYFGGDEKTISELLYLPEGTVSIILGFIGLLISIFIVFNVVPQKLRFTFMASGLFGGIAGFIFWMHFAGPIILPE